MACAAAPDNATVSMPTPTIKIDNASDPFATIVKVDFGDRLGELLDTIQALKNLGYNITRAKLSEDSKNKFFITNSETAEKVTKSAELEAIRQCILQTMMEFHPEAEDLVGTGGILAEAKPAFQPLGAERHAEVATKIRLETPPDSPFTRLEVTTMDRPGLLVDIVRTLKDCNVNVISAEVDTIGAEATDEFMLTYHGHPLSSSMRTLVRNALRYYLALAEIETAESY